MGIRLRWVVPLCLTGLSACALLGRAPSDCLTELPRRFAPGLVTSDEKELSPAFSPDGREFYFTRTSPGRARSWILVSRLDGGAWSVPVPVTLFDDSLNRRRVGERSASLSPDGQWLYFVSDHDHPARERGLGTYDIWRARRVEGGWGEPERLGGEVNTHTSEESPVITADGTLYFASGRPGGFGSMDLYRSRSIDGSYGPVENLGPVVNSAASEEGVYVTPDGRLMILAARVYGSEGRSVHMLRRPDLFVSTRGRGGWAAPRPVAPRVNTDEDEFGPTLSPDRRTLYFVRDATLNYATDLDASVDIWEVDACVLAGS